jgi:hypothetical protein
MNGAVLLTNHFGDVPKDLRHYSPRILTATSLLPSPKNDDKAWQKHQVDDETDRFAIYLNVTSQHV